MSGEMNTVITNTERLKITKCGVIETFATNTSSVRSILFCKHWWLMKNLSYLCLAACSLLHVLLHRSLPVITGKLLISPGVIKSLPENVGILSRLFSTIISISTEFIFCRVVERCNSLFWNWSNMGNFTTVIRRVLYLLQNSFIINVSKVWIFEPQNFFHLFLPFLYQKVSLVHYQSIVSPISKYSFTFLFKYFF